MLSVFGLNCYLKDIRPHHCPQTPLKQEYTNRMVIQKYEF